MIPTLSRDSFVGKWVDEQTRNSRGRLDHLIQTVVFPILAATDMVICLSLTVTVLPVFLLGTEHLKNTIGSIVIFVRSLFTLVVPIERSDRDLFSRHGYLDVKINFPRLSASSLSGRWLMHVQKESETLRRPYITAVALPILAALDTIICVSLTCTIVPLIFLGKQHLKNTIAAVVLLAKSFFFKYNSAPQVRLFDFDRPYLSGMKPINRLILNHQSFTNLNFLRDFCCHSVDAGNDDYGIVIGTCDIAIAAQYLKGELKLFDALNKCLDKENNLNETIVLAFLIEAFWNKTDEKGFSILDYAISKLSINWVRIIIEANSEEKFVFQEQTIYQMISKFSESHPETVQKMCAVLLDEIPELEFNFILVVALYDLKFAQELISKNLLTDDAMKNADQAIKLKLNNCLKGIVDQENKPDFTVGFLGVRPPVYDAKSASRARHAQILCNAGATYEFLHQSNMHYSVLALSACTVWKCAEVGIGLAVNVIINNHDYEDFNKERGNLVLYWNDDMKGKLLVRLQKIQAVYLECLDPMLIGDFKSQIILEYIIPDAMKLAGAKTIQEYLGPYDAADMPPELDGIPNFDDE